MLWNSWLSQSFISVRCSVAVTGCTTILALGRRCLLSCFISSVTDKQWIRHMIFWNFSDFSGLLGFSGSKIQNSGLMIRPYTLRKMFWSDVFDSNWSLNGYMEGTFVKSIFAKSVLIIYPDPGSWGLDWWTRFRWGLFSKLKNRAIRTLGSDHSQCHFKHLSNSFKMICHMIFFQFSSFLWFF